MLLGKQGAGKGTQAELLAERFGMRHLSTGTIFRESAGAGVPAGVEAKAYMDRGELVPDDVVVAVVEERFRNPVEVERGFVLDGFPRTLAQAHELDRILDGHRLELVIDLEVPTEVVVARMKERGRDDDTDDAIRRRLELYDRETKPLCDLYRARELLVSVDGVGDVEEVHRRLVAAIDARWDPVGAEIR